MKKGLRVVFIILFSILLFTGCEKAGENKIVDLVSKEVTHGEFNYKNKYIKPNNEKISFVFQKNEINFEIVENNLMIHYLDNDYIAFENVSSVYHNDEFDNDSNFIIYLINADGELYKLTFNNSWTSIDEVVANFNKEKIELDSKVNEFVLAYNNEFKQYTDPAIYCDNEVILYLSNLKVFDPEQNVIDNKYVLYNDKSLSTVDGKYFVYDDGKTITIKDYVILDTNNEISVNTFDSSDDSEFKTNVLFITENDEVVIESENDKAFIYGAKVKEIGYSGSLPYIKFVDNSSLVLNAKDFEINNVAK